MDLMQIMKVSGSGMAAQSARMKVISENIANVDSAEGDRGGPYRRQVVSFQTVTDNATGLKKVKVASVTPDYHSPMRQVFDPTHPAANAQGFVEMPNVDTVIESTDLREASRAYEANINVIENTKNMMARSLDLMR
ncbi:MAG: flagellar basal body rod protein FlgC [Proteobacteria bacterium]|nr:flagellar basal body rod protein FlgC [Pseudomonadota bacterium]